MIPARGELSIQSTDDGHAIAVYNPILIACFTRAPRSEELDRIRRLSAEALAQGVRGGVLYVVARPNMSGGIDGKVRSTVESLIQRNSGRAGNSAVVVLTPGLGGSIVRGALAGLVLLTANRRSLQVFPAVDRACAWLAQMHTIDSANLLRAYQRVTAHLTMPVSSSGPPSP